MTDHASGTAENPILVDSSWERLMLTGSPGKDIEKQPQPNTLPSERTEENSQATGMKKEAQTLVSPQETSQGGTIPYSSSEEGSTHQMGSVPVPENPIKLASTEDGEDQSEEIDKANTREMDTQKPQLSKAIRSSPQYVPMDIKQEEQRPYRR